MRKILIEQDLRALLLIQNSRTVGELVRLLNQRGTHADASEVGQVVSEQPEEFRCSGVPSIGRSVVTILK